MGIGPEPHLGETRPVLFESENNSGVIHGFTDNYIKVKLPFESSLVNQVTDVTLEEIDADGEMHGSNFYMQHSTQHPTLNTEH